MCYLTQIKETQWKRVVQGPEIPNAMQLLQHSDNIIAELLGQDNIRQLQRNEK